MSIKHHYSSEEIEKFAIRVISKSYDKSYADFIWHNKEDNFDFTSKNNEIALEVTSIMCDNIKNAIEYDKALDKNKKPDISKVEWGHINENGRLFSYKGGSIGEITEKILSKIISKEKKRSKRAANFKKYELCLCIDDGCLFNTPEDFDFILDTEIMKETKFSKLFLITSCNFFVIENDIVKEYKRII